MIPHRGERRALTWSTNPHMRFLFTLCCVFPVSPSIFLFFSVSFSLSSHPFALTLSHSISFFLVLSSFSFKVSCLSLLFFLCLCLSVLPPLQPPSLLFSHAYQEFTTFIAFQSGSPCKVTKAYKQHVTMLNLFVM